MPQVKANEYLRAELGALLGAVLAVPSAAGVFYIALLAFRFQSGSFEDLEDLARFAVAGLATGVLVLILVSSFGCSFALRRAGYPAAKGTARMLFLLLLVTCIAGFASTVPVSYEPLDPARFVLVPLVMPLVATWIKEFVPKSVKIQALALLLLGLGAYGIFSI